MAVYHKRLKVSGADLAVKHSNHKRRGGRAPELSVSQLRLLLESGPGPEDITLVSEMARRTEVVISSIRVEEGQSILVPFGGDDM